MAGKCLSYIADSTMALFSKLLIVVPTEEVMESFLVSTPDGYGTWGGFDCGDAAEKTDSLAAAVQNKCGEAGIATEVMVKQQEQEAFYSMYGGILFVGGILGVLFILCTVMIIYYKQIMMVFFLPLITAVIHSAVALRIVAGCLTMVVTVP